MASSEAERVRMVVSGLGDGDGDGERDSAGYGGYVLG